MQGQVFLKGGELAHFIFNFVQGLLFLHLEITLQSHHQLQDTANISWHQQFTSAGISSQSLVRTAAGDDLLYVEIHVNKCLCCQAEVWCILQLMITLLNYFTVFKIVLCIWRKLIFFCHHSFMKKRHSKLSKNEPENTP